MVCFITRFVVVQLLSVGVFSQTVESNPEGSVASNWEGSDRPFDFGEVLRALREEAGEEEEDDGKSMLRLLTAHASSGPSTNTTNGTTTPAPNATNSSSSGHKVQLEMRMDVTDPTAYVAAAATHSPVIASGLASTLNVPASTVSVGLTVASGARRLSSTALRRLTTSYVKIDANVSVATAADATDLKTLSDSKTAAQFMTALEAAYTSAGVTAPAGMNVTGVTSAVVAPAGSSPATGVSSSGATKLSFSAVPLFAVSAWLISRL